MHVLQHSFPTPLSSCLHVRLGLHRRTVLWSRWLGRRCLSVPHRRVLTLRRRRVLQPIFSVFWPGRIDLLLGHHCWDQPVTRSEEHTSELQSLMRTSYAVFCLKKKKNQQIDSVFTPVQKEQDGSQLPCKNHQT